MSSQTKLIAGAAVLILAVGGIVSAGSQHSKNKTSASNQLATSQVSKSQPSNQVQPAASQWLNVPEWGIKFKKDTISSSDSLAYLFQNNQLVVVYKKQLDSDKKFLSDQQLSLLSDCLNNSPRSSIGRQTPAARQAEAARGGADFPAVKTIGSYEYSIGAPNFDCTNGDARVANIMNADVWFYDRSAAIQAIESL